MEIHGDRYPIRASVQQLDTLSAHADSNELIEWLRPLTARRTRRVFVTHGEMSASTALAARIGSDLELLATVPTAGKPHVLD